MLDALQAIIDTLKRALGDKLEAVYLFGSLAQGHYLNKESDINLAILVQEGTPMLSVHQAFQPIWLASGDYLRRAPFVATADSFNRYLKLDPLLAQHMIRHGQQLLGSDDLLDRSMATVDPHEAYAFLATEAMQVSAALAPSLLDAETAVRLRHRLRKLARKLRTEPLPEDETAVQSFARIQHFLNPIMARLPATLKWSNTVPKGGTSPLLPGLQAVYDESGTLILVFDTLTPHQITQTDWETLATRLPDNCKQMQVTTVEQMSLSIMFERPLDLRFKKLKHTWGPNFVGAFNPSRRQIMRYAARGPSRILVNDLPNAYLHATLDDEALHRLIHDFQNKMLNIQLEHELLCRFDLSERFAPPQPVPGRETPPQERVDALFQHLNWWADFYNAQITG